MDGDDQVTILVADDDPAVLTLISRQLEKQGYRVLPALSGVHALETAREHPLDLLVSDWMMPGMSGIELCQAIKGDPNLSSIYVILLTSLNTPVDVATGLDAGADDYLSKPFRAVELAARIRAGLRITRLQRDLSHRNLELAELASTDPLTGIRNRYALECALSAVTEQHIRWQKPLSLVLFDIDNFKNVNDELGHPAGDHLLRTLTEAVRIQVRRSDVFGRFGGDEFLLILPETSSENAVECAERVRATALTLSIEGEMLDDADLPVTLSAGVVTWTPLSDLYDVSVSDLITAADEALYRAKKKGRNCIASTVLPLEWSDNTGTQVTEPVSRSMHRKYASTRGLPVTGMEQREGTRDGFAPFGN